MSNSNLLRGYLIKTKVTRSQVDAALIYDSVLLFAKALNELDRNDYVQMRSLSCDGTETWTHGHSLVNYMKMVNLMMQLVILSSAVP